MAINAKKSACLRFGTRCGNDCCNIVTGFGNSVNWVDSARYLGVFLYLLVNSSVLLMSIKLNFIKPLMVFLVKLVELLQKKCCFS